MGVLISAWCFPLMAALGVFSGFQFFYVEKLVFPLKFGEWGGVRDVEN